MPKKNINNFTEATSPEDRFNSLAKQNQELLEELRHLTGKINQYLVFTQVMTVLKVIFIVVPIVLTIIYLPPLLKNFLEPYQKLLSPSSLGNVNSYLPK